MARGRRHLRGRALALMLQSSSCFGVAVVPMALMISQPAQAPEAKRVAINIVVIEADKKSKNFDERLAPLRKAIPENYTGAKILDDLKTSAEEGSSVSLEISRSSGEARLLRVTVRK